MTRFVSQQEIHDAALAYKGSRRRNPNVDHITEGGVYTSAKGKHCVVGQILADLDIPLPAQEETWKTVIYSGRALLDVEMNRQGVMRLAEWLAAVHDVRLDPAAVSALNTAQGDTDSGLEWGRALREGGVL